MDQFTKEGRKLRPRKTAAQRQPNFEKVEYSRGEFNDDSRPRQYGERRSYGENRGGYGERRGGYGQGRGAYGSRGGSGRGNYSGGDGYRQPEGGYGRRSDSDRPSYGDHRPRQYGERRSYGENRGGYGERRETSYGDRRPRQYDNGEGYGERRPRQYGERRSYGENRGTNGSDRPRREYRNAAPGKPAAPRRKNAPKPGSKKLFSKDSFEGITRMIERRPVVNGSEGAEQYETPIKDVVRLNKFIANSGVCSRREADTLIQAGVVTVNGEVVTELGTKVNIHDDDVRFNGERLKGEAKVYIIMNKPKGYVTTASDPHADKTVLDLVDKCPARVYPVGRLDKNTTGVLLLTNDGEIAERLTHPSYDKKKIYQVALDKELSEEDRDRILAGVELSDGVEKADELEYIDPNDKRKLGIEIHSGKNRIVRRLFESQGYNVKALDRVYFAGLTKKGLKKGEWRFLTESEVNILKMGAYV